MVAGEFPVLTSTEAQPFLPELQRVNTTGEYHFEPEVFHSLHCLNEIRKEVSKSLYPNSTYKSHEHIDPSYLPAGFQEAHMEHCVDRLRQAIMCHGDLTPSPLYSWPEHSTILLGRTKEHTCRKWRPIRDWMDERWRESPKHIH